MKKNTITIILSSILALTACNETSGYTATTVEVDVKKLIVQTEKDDVSVIIHIAPNPEMNGINTLALDSSKKDQAVCMNYEHKKLPKSGFKLKIRKIDYYESSSLNPEKRIIKTDFESPNSCRFLSFLK